MSSSSSIVDDLPPGTVAHRRVEVSNTTASVIHAFLYTASAGEQRTDEASTWTSVTPDVADIPAGGRVIATVTIAVPADADPGARSGVVWAEVRSDPNASGVTQANRVGIRTSLSVQPGGLPAANFAIDSVSAARSPDGHPVVRALVHNTGGRILDLTGSIRLSATKPGLAGGPFPVTLGSTVAIGDTEQIEVALDHQLPLGPWLAELTLTNGSLERTARATVTFPREHEGSSTLIAEGASVLFALLGLGLGIARSRRRRTSIRLPTAQSPARTRPWRGRRAIGIGVLSVTLLLAGLVGISSPAYAVTAPVALGRAESFSALSGFGVTSTGATFLSGDLGASTAISVVGFPPGVVGGDTYIGNPTVPLALSDLQLAYNDAAGRGSTNVGIAGDLNGLTFLPGVYHADAALAVTGTVTLNGNGDNNAVFIFQVGAAFDTAAASNVNLINGAHASNVFWQVVGAAGIGANASFSGTIMAASAITIGANATLAGRALSTGGAITLATNTITTPNPSGTLSISVPTGTVSLGSFTDVPGGQLVGGLLGIVEVEDTRGGSSNAGWVASVGATAFTTADGRSIPASSVSYSAGDITQIRGAFSYTVLHPGDLTNPAPTVAATGVSGDNNAMTMWNPAISIFVPSNSFSGMYSATLTQSVL